jgi:GNAT superfamily N-acetyltransferase
MLPPEVVEEIYAAAAAQPPLSEPPSVAKMFADLYRHARTEAGAVMTIATVAGAPVGFAYGHNWNWDRATDPWSTELRNRLGEQAAQRIENSFALELLAVTPTASGAGIGRQLLSSLLEAAMSSTAWLQTTDIDSPAQHLYLATGWRTLGHGPDAPNGKPGLVMINQTPYQD